MTDSLAFAGTAVASAALAFALHLAGVGADTPPWAFLAFVVCIDVAHVWSTLFRTYLDADELRARPMLYAAAPLLAFGLSVAACAHSPATFWRLLAYVAVWHFVRQQVGWMALYGRRAGHGTLTLRLDALVMYATTLGPVVWWHAHLPRPFWWFQENDFVGGLPAWVGDLALGLHFAVLAGWLGFSLARRQLHAGKALLVFATWVSWFGGIVLAQSDLAFTVMNVALHGVPYLVLVRQYAKGREAEGRFGVAGALVRGGVPAFLGLLVALAFVEEGLWDRLVWHDHAVLFGGGVELSAGLLTLLVPLLALPQTTHYVLDGFVWTSASHPRLRERLGW
ncbi:MAG: hypothetical protein U0228_39695 [Myxococcaceae bacterium]